MNQKTLLTEIFPIKTSSLPKLYGYKLDIGKIDSFTIGGKLSYRLGKKFSGNWLWTSSHVVTDSFIDNNTIKTFIEQLWKELPDIFSDLRGISFEEQWEPPPQAYADYVARSLVKWIRESLKDDSVSLGNAKIERQSEIRGWVIHGKPAISISIFSRLVYNQDLAAYIKSLSNQKEVLNLWVADKTSSFKGEIVEILGPLSKHKKRLSNLTKREEILEIINNSSDEDQVIKVLGSGHQTYDYPASALKIILRIEDMGRFGVNPRDALNKLRLEPSYRAELVKKIFEVTKSQNFLENAFNSKRYSQFFLTPKEIEYEPKLLFNSAAKISVNYNERNLLSNLRTYGLYKINEKFTNGSKIRIGIINSISGFKISGFIKKLCKSLEELKFGTTYVGEEEIKIPHRSDLEIAINKLIKNNPDIIIVFLPDEYSDEDENYAYFNVKSLTINRGFASQVVYKSTLEKVNYALDNVILGILSKVGNIPFILDKPLPYADLVVGIDVARERKKRLKGSINATATARVYFGNGEFLRYVIHDAPLEGETIPQTVLQALFPMDEFRGKQVLIHRDGFFRGEEKRVLKEWAEKIKAKFYLVEIIKSGAPRIYLYENSTIAQPPKGSAFLISETEALLVSTLSPFTDATAQPLRVRCEKDFSIRQALHSILSLTLLHYGSVRPPRLPVTIHYSDQIARLALKGIKPKNLEGNTPFWL
ncbi:MAG: Piwi domain-containing protein [Candidatus Aenigmatarchaeota archaeon]